MTCSAESRAPRHADGRQRPPSPPSPASTPTSSAAAAAASPADMNAAVRAEAVSRLLRVEKSGVFVGALPWKEEDEQDDEERRESSSSTSSSSPSTSMAATTDLVAGATRWRRALDAALSSLCGRSVEDLDAPLRQVLRIALYELASTCRREGKRGGGAGRWGRLRKDPASAAAGIVASAVDLSRRSGHAGSAQLANAVLRRAAKAILDEGEEGEDEEGREGEGEEISSSLLPLVPLLPRSLLPPPPPPDAPERARLRSLAVSWSHPDWLVKRWVQRFGAEGAERLLAANNRRPRHALRAVVVAAAARSSSSVGGLPPSLLLGRALDALVEEDNKGKGGKKRNDKPVVWRRSVVLLDEFVVVERGMGAAISGVVVKKAKDSLSSSLPSAPTFRVSAAVQDEASGAVVALADPRPGMRVLDVCAAPGGKALFAAARMRGQGTLVARDSSAARLGPLRDAAEAQGVRAPFLVVEEADGRGKEGEETGAAPAAAAAPLFDLVLVDAPCSGTGVLAKRADARWRKEEADLATLTALQDSLLASASRQVRPDGGRLVYSTCSLEPEENAERVRAFLRSAAGEGFELEGVDPGALGLPRAMITREGFLEALPHVHGTDGAFGARMVRRW